MNVPQELEKAWVPRQVTLDLMKWTRLFPVIDNHSRRGGESHGTENERTRQRPCQLIPCERGDEAEMCMATLVATLMPQWGGL
jgi:hypothetical protein